MSGISLTASMRSNLLSLQNIAGQQDIVQNRLATGLKVSSAIDNPSSYYTASSLNNRAADLTALLDSMSQGIQVIKAASEAIESGTKFLEQAKAVANQALETAIPAKEWFVEQVGENGAVVETEAELRQAIADNKETICIYGTIDLGDISTKGGLALKTNQKLVGIGYFGNFSNQHSQIKAITKDKNQSLLVVEENYCTISNVSLHFEDNVYESGNCGAIYIKRASAYMSNIDITANFNNVPHDNRAAIIAQFGATIDLSGNINIKSTGDASYSIYTFRSDANINANLNVNKPIYALLNGTVNVKAETQICNLFSSVFRHSLETDQGSSTLIVETGVKLLLGRGGNVEKAYKVKSDYIYKNTTSYMNNIDINNIELEMKVEETEIWNLSTDKEENLPSANYYNKILIQYNLLISDASYKGVNLLTGQNLTINFNEDRGSKIEIAGVKADSKNLGLKTNKWRNAGDIEDSIHELDKAINSLRSFASQFGNYYSIITTRQDFTENMINVLEEGADKLALADMNQESVNMLALQTSQQLAVNSLSLASQASQSILKLF